MCPSQHRLITHALIGTLVLGVIMPLKSLATEDEAEATNAQAEAAEVFEPEDPMPPQEMAPATQTDTESDAVMYNPELPKELFDKQAELTAQSTPSDEIELTTQSISELGYEPYRNNIWFSDAGDAIYFVTRTEEDYETTYHVHRYDLNTCAAAEIYSTTSDRFCYANDTFYTCHSMMFRPADSDEYVYKNTLHRIDLVTGTEETLELEGIESPYKLGVDDTGKLYVQYYESTGDTFVESLAIFDSTGTLLATKSDVPPTNGFLGFDTTTGNFYFEGNYDGDDGQDMASLNVGNFDEASGTITISDKPITISYQKYIFDHHGCAELINGRYLVDLSTFQGDTLGIFDSWGISPNNVAETMTEMPLINSSVRVPLAALPESTLLFAARTHESDYGGDLGEDVSGVGPRVAYLTDNDIMAVATQRQQVTLYRLSDKAQLGFVQTDQPIYKVMSSGNSLCFIEKTADGAFTVEHMKLTFTTAINLIGPSEVTAGDSPDYEVSLNGNVRSDMHITSSNPSVLSIDDAGAAAAWKAGTATITAKTDDGLETQLSVTVSARTEPTPSTGVVKTKGTIIHNWQDHDYATYGKVVNSYLVETDDGLMRVQSDGNRVLIEYYNASGSVTLRKSITNSLPEFGGYYHDEDGSNYLVFGRANSKESDSLVVVRVIRYDSAWKEQGRCDIKGINTLGPFNAGSLRMDAADGRLYIHTCHAMYKSDDGLRHQANMSFAIDQASMSLVYSSTGIASLGRGYVSHSFNQYVRIEDGYLYRVDHGDASPRGIALTKTPLSKNLSEPELFHTVASFRNKTDSNYTGASVGGLEISDTHALIAWNEDASESSSVRNVYVTAVDKTEGTTSTTTLTKYKSTTICFTPQLVKIDGRHFLALWTEHASKKNSYTLAMANLDQAGRLVGAVVRKNLPASDCQPILCHDGSVRWLVSSTWDVRICAIDPLNLSAAPQDTMNDDIVSCEDIGDTYVTLANQAWTGKALKPNPEIYGRSGKLLKRGTDYTVSYANNIDIGTATVTITGKGSFRGIQKVTFKIVKAPNTLKVKAVTRTVKQTAVRKKAVVVNPPLKITRKAMGTVAYTKTAGPKNFVVNTNTGKVTVKKGTKKGTYTIKIKVRAAGTKTYRAAAKTIKTTIVVK